jgi:hypothetical protein
MQSSHGDQGWIPDWIPNAVQPTTRSNDAAPDHVQPNRNSISLYDASYNPSVTDTKAETVEGVHPEPKPSNSSDVVITIMHDEDRVVK